MKQNLEASFLFTLKAEGGYCVDHAGATKCGVTIGMMKVLKMDLDHDGDIDDADVRLVDADIARKVFRKEFWDRIGADNLPAGIDLQAADFAYNAGPMAATTMLRGNTPDLATYRQRRIAFYEGLCMRNPDKYEKYRKGWLSRAEQAYREAMKLAAKEA
jgi:lysozyme family protein